MPKLADKNSCTGCTACMSICPKLCIEMKIDKNGFAFPEVVKPELCIECGACERVCPILYEKTSREVISTAYAAFSRDETLRMDSSSGGIFSEIAKYVIRNKGVVYGAEYNEAFDVRHCFVDNMADLSKLRGAKYSESRLGNTFSEILERLKQGQVIMFVGTPCQVAGLRSFVKKDFDNLICIDFVCHGVPSPMAWKEYIKFRAKQDADGELPDYINLRSKITGWSKYNYSNLFQYKNGNKHSCISSQSLFMKLFVGDYISRPSCENCLFKGYSRVSDITLGDFWGIWDIDMDMDDNKGTSVVLVQSEKGEYIWNEIKSNIICKQVTLQEASRQNQSMLIASKSKKNRDRVLSMIRKGRIEACSELFISAKYSLAFRVKSKVGRLVHKVFKIY